MSPAGTFALCNDCASEGQKKYDLYLAHWKQGERVVCQRCKSEGPGAVYRLEEKDRAAPFTLGAHEYKEK